MKTTRILSMLALATGTLLAGSASATELISFDDLPGPSGVVEVGYAGLAWDNIYYVSPIDVGLVPSGYLAGTVSGAQVATNAYGNTASISSLSFEFNLDSLYLTGAWNDGLQVQLDGYRNGTLLYSTTYSVDSTAPTFVSPGFEGIDLLQISSYGGTQNVEYYGGGSHVVIDDVSVTPVPEASTYGLIGAGSLAGLAFLRRRTRRKTI